MAIKRKIWMYPDTNPTIGKHFDSNGTASASSTLVSDYLRITFTMTQTGGNGYLYAFIPTTAYTVQSGDFLEYDIFLESNQPAIGTDVHFANGALRDAGITDQNGVSVHPATDLRSQAFNKWYRRRIPITTSTGGSTIGQALNYLNVVCELDTAGTYVAYYKNLAITDGNGVAVDNLTSFATFF
jgi:hypothetical protein